MLAGRARPLLGACSPAVPRSSPRVSAGSLHPLTREGMPLLSAFGRACRVLILLFLRLAELEVPLPEVRDLHSPPLRPGESVRVRTGGVRQGRSQHQPQRRRQTAGTGEATASSRLQQARGAGDFWVLAGFPPLLCSPWCHSLQSRRGSVCFPAVRGSCAVHANWKASQARDVRILVYKMILYCYCGRQRQHYPRGPHIPASPPGCTAWHGRQTLRSSRLLPPNTAAAASWGNV